MAKQLMFESEAREAVLTGVAKLAPFHFSPRYKGREGEIVAEAAAAFGGDVVMLPTIGRVTPA